jgi:uncharacterized damage-inducible protein DinB
MSKKEEIINELKAIYDGEAWHADNLTEILDGVPAAQAGKRPIADAHSIREIVAHIAAWNDVWAERLDGRNILEPSAGDFPAAGPDDKTAWAKALCELKRSHLELIDKIENVRDSDMPHEFMNKGYTLGFFLEGIVRHTVYHSGQIAILKKA